MAFRLLQLLFLISFLSLLDGQFAAPSYLPLPGHLSLSVVLGATS